jgi:hypothetical protein
VVERQDPGDLPLDQSRVGRRRQSSMHLADNVGVWVVLAENHADLLGVPVEAEGQPHEALEALGVPLAEAELDGLL